MTISINHVEHYFNRAQIKTVAFNRNHTGADPEISEGGSKLITRVKVDCRFSNGAEIVKQVGEL